MLRLLALSSLAALAGLSLLFSEMRWFRRPSLVDRLAPYSPGLHRSGGIGVFSVASFREVIVPLSQLLGERAAQVFGVNEDMGLRLRRIHSPIDTPTFRVRQLGWSGASMLGGAAIAVGLQFSTPFAMLAVGGTPLLMFLMHEQRVASASEQWQRRLFLELPVVAEQLAMLTGAGWSLTAALARVAGRGTGNCARDLQRVGHRMRQGVGEVEALREWGRLAEVDALDRLISVLSLNREAADLGGLISEEARSIRREAQRELIETIEKRNQQVWVPVTIAALIPGVLLMGVPFLDALTLFSTS